MDLVYNYLPDVYSYQSLRHSAGPSHDTYSWLPQYGNRKDAYRGDKQLRKNQSCTPGKNARDSCPICQEKQRRPLAKYIRSKSQQDRKPETSIEEEEEEEENTVNSAKSADHQLASEHVHSEKEKADVQDSKCSY